MIINCNLEKCSECIEESNRLNLCSKCKIKEGYFPLNIGINIKTEINIILLCEKKSNIKARYSKLIPNCVS